MIIWLASYPKSGNTLVRSLLSSYFFSADGIYQFDQIKNISQFPDIDLFKKFGVNTDDENETLNNYIKIQEKINKKKSIQFYKTHSSLFNISGKAFTDLNNSFGVIYIVRDPRNIVISWNYNFQSWKSFKFQKRYLLIKYEDLIKDKKQNFLKILKFINRFRNEKIFLDLKKIDNILNTTTFEKMKKKEMEEGFFEAMTDKKSGKKRPFFHMGPDNDWSKILDVSIRSKIEDAFQTEMKELGYLK